MTQNTREKFEQRINQLEEQLAAAQAEMQQQDEQLENLNSNLTMEQETSNNLIAALDTA